MLGPLLIIHLINFSNKDIHEDLKKGF